MVSGSYFKSPVQISGQQGPRSSARAFPLALGLWQSSWGGLHDNHEGKARNWLVVAVVSSCRPYTFRRIRDQKKE